MTEISLAQVGPAVLTYEIISRIHVVSQFCLNSPCFPHESEHRKSDRRGKPQTPSSLQERLSRALNSLDPKTLHASEI